MGKIIKTMKVYGDKAELEIPILLDTGATNSIIRKDVAEKIVSHFDVLKTKVLFKGVNGKPQLESYEVCTLEIGMKNYVLNGLFYVSKELNREIIVGSDFMQRWDIKLDPKNEDFTVGVNPNEIEII